MSHKFRAFDQKNKCWFKAHDDGLTFYGFHVFGECTLLEPPSLDALQHLVLTEYLGMSDMEQEEMYDGDIYKNNENGLVGVLKVVDTGLGYVTYATEFKDGEIYNHRPFYELDLTNFTKLGNIFEHTVEQFY